MKTNIFNSLIILSLLSLLIACDTKKTESNEVAIDKEQIKKEIQDKENEFAETYNSGIPKSIGYYSDDAVSFTQNRAPLVGKDAIVEYLFGGLNQTTQSNKISFTTNEVFVSNDGNQVVEIGYYSVVDSTNTNINTGNYMVLFEKRNGKYVCVREMSTSDMPLE